ncbi:MAG: O-antigen ligase family protein [Terriglobales bacterium]
MNFNAVGHPATFQRADAQGVAARNAFGSTVAKTIVLAAIAPAAALSRPAARRILVIAMLLDIPLQIGKYFFYDLEAAAAGALGGLGISLTTLALVGLCTSLAIERIVCPAPMPVIKANRYFVAYVAVVCASVLVARNTSLALFDIALLLQMAVVYICLLNWMNTRDDVLFVVRWVMIGIVVESLIVLALAAAGDALNLPVLRTRVDEGLRIGGTVGSPNNAGTYFAVFFALALSLSLSAVDKRTKRLALATTALAGIGLLLTFSRGAWVGCGASMLVFVVARSRTRSKRFMGLIGLAVVTLACLSFSNPVSNRLLREDQGAARARLPLMALAGHIILDHPVFGVGANNFTEVIPNYLTRAFAGEWVYAVHNKFLLIWSESGTFALLAYVLFLLTTMREAWRCWRAGDPVLSPLALGLLCGLIAYSLDVMTAVSRGRSDNQSLVTIAALVGEITILLVKEAPERSLRQQQGRL